MAPLRPLVALLGALALALAGGVAAAAGAGGEALTPAPPPAMYCRVAPDGAWPAIGAGLAPDLTPYQDYRAGLAIPAGETGAGVRIGDVEYEWAATHADLQPRGLPSALASGLGGIYPQVRDHGTAVLGILGAADDGHGITGLVPSAKLVPVSPIVQPLQAYQPAAAIDTAAAGLGPGDVLLIEQQAAIRLSTSQTVYGPIEYFDTPTNPVRTAIAKAVAKGVVVVEPAGNGDLDLGTLTSAPWLSSAADPKTSGALIVGAGGAGIGEGDVLDRQRVPGSNWGARVDVQGFGSGVVSSGYGDISSPDADADHAYTACFDGTSSASATVAGAVAALQAGVIARRGTPLTPAQVRTVLRSTGLAQAAPSGAAAADNIGPRPQVSAALAALAAGPPPSSPDDAVVTAPVDTAGARLPVPAPPGGRVGGATVVPTLAPAAAGLSIRLDRAHRRLTVRLRGAARSAVVRVGRRIVKLRGGVVVLRGVRPGRIVVRVSAGAGHRAVAFRITVPVNGAPDVARLG